MQVVMMGLGYIGLPTAALIASKGIHVLGVDVNAKVVDTINKGEIHIVEPDLDGLVNYDVRQGYLKAATQPAPADVFMIAVPTPFKGDHEPDISYVENATKMVLPHLKPGNLFIIESTSPVGTTEKMSQIIATERPELLDKIFIAYCPERVLPGSVIYELQNNDRVIGGLNPQSTTAAIEFYGKFVKGNLHKTNSRTAEMCKLTENAYRDVNIAFANELSIICDKAAIDVNELIDLASKHPRVKILKPGPGVGGHCIAVDPWFIVADFKDEAKIIKQARLTNNYKKDWVTAKIKAAAHQFKTTHHRDATIACMGLAYKPDIDDLRESPSIEILEELIHAGYKTLAVEPNVNGHPQFKITDSAKACLDADIIVFLVSHREFKNLPINADKVLLDFCGVRK
ncbi:MAG: UDP-N-acetyl-D-mannosamine dehydrogenase [Bacteroidota bacterium]|jgi:UDP-N-acetyl-D-mannosaminuronic acid dehydrogenase